MKVSAARKMTCILDIRPRYDYGEGPYYREQVRTRQARIFSTKSVTALLTFLAELLAVVKN